MPSPFPYSPVIREWSWMIVKENPDRKKTIGILGIANLYSTCGALMYSLSKLITHRSSKEPFRNTPTKRRIGIVPFYKSSKNKKSFQGAWRKFAILDCFISLIKCLNLHPTNIPRLFHVETTWKRPWCVCR